MQIEEIDNNKKYGFIALYRSILEHWIAPKKPVTEFEAWIIILLTVQWKDEIQQVAVGYRIFECGRGDSIKSLLTWSKIFGWNVSKTRRFFKKLEKANQIRTKSEQKTTRLTVCNFDSYQDWRNDYETKVKRKRNESETKVTTDNKGNKDNKGNNDKKFESPSLEDVKNFFLKEGFRADVGERAFYHYDGNDWKDKNDKPVKNWKNKMRVTWFKDEHKIKKKLPPYGLTDGCPV